MNEIIEPTPEPTLAAFYAGREKGIKMESTRIAKELREILNSYDQIAPAFRYAEQVRAIRKYAAKLASTTEQRNDVSVASDF